MIYSPADLVDFLGRVQTIPFTVATTGDPPTITVHGPSLQADTRFGTGNLTPSMFGGIVPSFTIPEPEWADRKTRAAAVAYGASGGDTTKDVGLSTAGGTNRGLWGLNDVKYPTVNAADAHNELVSTWVVWYVTRGFTDWSAFAGNPGLDPSSAAYAAILAATEDRGGYVVDDTFAALGGLTGWAEALGALLSNLIDPQWWRRIGVGALGLLLVIVAVALTLAK